MREKSGSGISRALWIAVLSGGVGAAIPAEGRAAVVINEIHYNPRAPDGKTLEFIELFNASGRTVSLGGWQFTNGVEYVFPAAAALPAGGFAVVCRDRDAFIDRFGAGELLFGNYVGALDNDGEEVVLADAFGAVIDAVRYDDSTPWPSFADGNGASLQRLCADAGSHRWDNWVGAPIDAPTPLRPSSRAVCPLPPLPPPRITFSEVHYHPPDDLDEFEEFIELHNPGPEPVDLAGWRFSDGVAFTFLGDASILPGGYLVVARNQEHMRRSFAIVNVVGDFTGELSNSGERINLVDETNALVDTVFYRDAGEWPYAADGLDRSLEKIDFSRSSDDPANWTHSILPSGEFRHVAGEGPISSLTQQRIVIGIDGVGDYIVDNVRLERVDDPGVNLLPNGDFESGLGDWLPRGNTVESRVEDAIGVGGGGVRGGRGLRVISSAGCTPCGSVDSVSYTWLRGELDNSVEYRLSFDFLRVSGSTDLFVRMLRGVESPVARAMVGPGRAPTHGLERTPPHLSHRGRFPEEPEAGDPVTLTMRVRWIDGEPPPTVTLTYFRADVELREEVSLVMFDDGAHRDGLPGDGTFGATLPGLPHNAQVHYIVTAEASGGGPSRVSPLAVEAESRLPSEFWGYYVYSDPPDSVLPVYHLLIPGVDPSNPEAVNRALNCNTLRPAGFAVRGELYPAVGLRFRGNTACVLKKRNLKVRFNRGHEFLGLRKMNLQGLWTDKGLVREHLAWQFMGEVGAPYCETWYTRLHINGAYHGLFLYLEHPDERFLRRNDLDDDGCLYKARQPPRNGGTPIGVARQSNLDRYEGFWERETCEERDLSELAEFVGALHADAVRPGPTAEFHLERTFPDMLIPYQIGQVVLHNIDSFAKNHFLYQSSGDKRWGLITWDMDLVFGKFFDPDSVGPGRPVGTLNDCML
ncbi:MAG: lamin tail domain-containing protein, partial [Planctomycetota bacterium]|nr:lamin tail domain-containing protein [Planctomycetota bacterium]